MDENITAEHPAQTVEEPTKPTTEPARVPTEASDEPTAEASTEPTAETEAVKSTASQTDEDDVAQTRTNADVIASGRGRGRRVLTILAAVLMFAVLAAVAGGAYATYDFKQEHDGKILPGAVVAGVDVGGMTEKQALRAVKKAIGPKLEQQITIGFRGKEWKVTPAELGARSNARSAIRSALAASEQASWRDLAGMKFLDEGLDIERDVSIRHSRKGALEFISGLEKEVDKAPVDAALDYSSGWVEIQKEKQGHELIVNKSVSDLMNTLEAGDSSSDLAVRGVAPEVTADSFDQVILVRQNDFRVYLYTDGKITHDWPIATGTSEYPTPTGVYSVELKRYMPTWVNPAPDGWGADMPAMIPPGPDNPLGLRAINWTAPAIRFHGTSALSSIGTPASHGCVRMLNEDVIQMYDLVEEGSPIVSIMG